MTQVKCECDEDKRSNSVAHHLLIMLIQIAVVRVNHSTRLKLTTHARRLYYTDTGMAQTHRTYNLIEMGRFEVRRLVDSFIKFVNHCHYTTWSTPQDTTSLNGFT